MQQGRRRPLAHPVVTVGGAGDDALEQAEHAAHPVHAIQRRDEMHFRRAGVGEAHIDPAANQGAHQAFRAVHPLSPPTPSRYPHPARRRRRGKAEDRSENNLRTSPSWCIKGQIARMECIRFGGSGIELHEAGFDPVLFPERYRAELNQLRGRRTIKARTGDQNAGRHSMDSEHRGYGPGASAQGRRPIPLWGVAKADLH